MPNNGKRDTEPPREIPAYESFIGGFRPDDVAALLSGDLETGMNVCVECCDRHAEAEGGRPALFWEGAGGDSSVHSFAELRDASARFANLLKSRGIGPGDRVAVMLPRIPELMMTALGIWRAGAVYVPMFTAFGPKAIEYRLDRSAARLVVTDTENRPKLEGIAGAPPIMVVARKPDTEVAPGDLDFDDTMDAQSADFEPVPRKGDDPFLMMFTSGTVGDPKGVPVPYRALLSFVAYMKYAVDLRPEDRFWNMADPGWAYGLFYAVVGALLMGNATHLYEGAFSAESTYAMLEKYDITVLASAPTAYRMLMAGGDDLPAARRLSLRIACSAGEPLNAEVNHWAKRHLGCVIHDQYGQTETGMVVCNHHGLRHTVRVGAMGMPVPGFRVVVLDEAGGELGPGTPGRLAIDTRASPLFAFDGYLEQEAPLDGPYYITGDLAELGDDGCLAFTGRNDDIISSAGYRIGPFDVESCLIEHPAVLESGVVGKPDAERGEIVVAYVVPGPGHNGSPELAEELRQFAKTRLSAHAYPREVVFVDQLPKTPSGKIQRYVLRERAG